MFLKQKNTGNVQLGGDDGCCPDGSNPVCNISFTIEDLTAITSITIDGNAHTITATDETDPGDIEGAILAAFEAEGYFENGEKPAGVIVYLDEWEDTNTVIEIFSNADTVTMTTTPAATPSDPACIQTVACRYKFELAVGALDFDLSDPAVEAANPGDSPQNVADTYNTGAGNTLAGDIADALGTLYGSEENFVFKRIKVVENLVTAKYEVQVWLYGQRVLELDGEAVSKCECVVDYTGAQ